MRSAVLSSAGLTAPGRPPWASGTGVAGAATLTPAEQLLPGQYGALAPPAELTRFGNGRIPPEALAPIGTTGDHLWAPAAAAFEQLSADAAAAGVGIGVNDAYRDYASQERLAAELGLYSQGGLAAVPGSSTHGWGLSVDLELDPAAQAWMRQNAAGYGFVEDVAREPWHWTYRPAS
ncbi:MAG: peptidase M15 [Acidimicrobiia bacterium]|nr:peptidase M15 [Acidimicrobiia bacterium]